MQQDRIRAAEEAALSELKEWPNEFDLEHVPDLSLADHEVFQILGKDGRYRGSASVTFGPNDIARASVRWVTGMPLI
jgi:hypothetical protein